MVSLLCEIFDVVTAVCLFVCMYVCISDICLRRMDRPHRWFDRPDFLTADVFWSKDDPNFLAPLVQFGPL